MKNLLFYLLFFVFVILIAFNFFNPIFTYISLFYGLIFLLYFIFTKRKNALKIIFVSLSFICILLNLILLFGINKESYSFVAHAGGGLENYTYLNTQESLNNSIEKGINYIELDFVYTSDNKIVCSHYFEYLTGYSFKNKIDYNTYENFNILNKYKGITLSNLFETMEENSNVKIIFDTKERDSISLINDIVEFSSNYNVDVFSRLIIQIYNKNQYETINNLGFEEIWFTNYKANYTINQINKFFNDKDKVTTIVLSYENFIIFKSFGFNTKKNIAVHTINSNTTLKFLTDRGVDFIFTDFLHNK